MKEITLSKAILEQIVAEVGGTMRDQVEELGLPPLEKEVRMKTSGEEVKTLEITFPDFLLDSVVPLLKYLDGKKENRVRSSEGGIEGARKPTPGKEDRVQTVAVDFGERIRTVCRVRGNLWRTLYL
ncbi:hypothetical protein AXG93_3338s1000 [Marchantia polymorpha subsp. ruderalis]|uniref:Uncharacterized protein n=1 Tax=Marchantia polymorpha subsp. ruderalis TaxID=1480154 RepID=A0A176VUZ5_MARPO|nr:hypothetical protein AXG93_3338s1000 [Marchantia polymorpha subsp. ruderalis]